VIADTSAIVAVVLEKPNYRRLAELLSEQPVAIGAPTLVETGIVLTARLGALGRSLLARLLDVNDIRILPFDEHHWALALDAFMQYGKGRHPARLNLGDCLTYATAKLAGEPLLCVGNDFPQTDLEIVPI
jgi:ribonuclease VapC